MLKVPKRLRTHAVVFLACLVFACLAFAPAALAVDGQGGSQAGSLPPAELFKPDSGVVSAGGSAAVFIKVVAWLVALVAGIYFAWAVFHFVFHDLREIFTGKADLKSKSGRFAALGVCFVILLLALTGQWYTVVKVVWDKIIVPLINILGGQG
jgi:hypothetical protein